MAKGIKKSKSGSKRERRERRFLPRTTTNPIIVYVLGALGALATGAGVWAEWGRVMILDAPSSLDHAPWILAAAAILLGLAIWFGTSGDPVLRVGDGGVGVERGNVRRMPWHGVESVAYDGAQSAIVVKGKDEAGAELAVVARLASQPQAATWIVHEAKERVPSAVDVGDNVALAAPRDDAGMVVKLDPVQVVGKRCVASEKIIAFEPDARVCPRCERVYHKANVPLECACGASLAALADATNDDASKDDGAADESAPSPA